MEEKKAKPEDSEKDIKITNEEEIRKKYNELQKQTNTIFVCMKCEKGYQNISNMKEHSLSKHENNPNAWSEGLPKSLINELIEEEKKKKRGYINERRGKKPVEKKIKPEEDEEGKEITLEEEDEEESVLDLLKTIINSETKIPNDTRDEVVEWLACNNFPSWNEVDHQFIQWVFPAIAGQLKNFGVGDSLVFRVIAKIKNNFDRKMMEIQKIKRMIAMPTYHQVSPHVGGVSNYFGHSYSPYWDSSREHYTPQQPPRSYKVIIDGQTVETRDADEFRALKHFEEERVIRKERHEKEMRLLDEQIKAEVKREVKTTENNEKEISIPIDEEGKVTINVPPREAWLWFMARQGSSSKEKSVLMNIEGQKVEVPASTAAFIEMRKKDENNEIKTLRELSNSQQKQILTLHEQVKTLSNRKVETVGKTTIDMIDNKIPSGSDLKEFASEIVKHLPPFSRREELRYEPKKTAGERKDIIDEIDKKLSKSEEELDVENKFIDAMMKL